MKCAPGAGLIGIKVSTGPEWRNGVLCVGSASPEPPVRQSNQG